MLQGTFQDQQAESHKYQRVLSSALFSRTLILFNGGRMIVHLDIISIEINGLNDIFTAESLIEKFLEFI